MVLLTEEIHFKKNRVTKYYFFREEKTFRKKKVKNIFAKILIFFWKPNFKKCKFRCFSKKNSKSFFEKDFSYFSDGIFQKPVCCVGRIILKPWKLMEHRQERIEDGDNIHRRKISVNILSYDIWVNLSHSFINISCSLRSFAEFYQDCTLWTIVELREISQQSWMSAITAGWVL